MRHFSQVKPCPASIPLHPAVNPELTFVRLKRQANMVRTQRDVQRGNMSEHSKEVLVALFSMRDSEKFD